MCRAKNRCSKHYLDLIRPHYLAKLATKSCRINGCEQSVTASELCVTHYHQEWRDKQALTDEERQLKYPEETLQESTLRFWQRVQLTADETRCWLLGTGRRQTYGTHSFGKQKWYGHHFAWFITHGYKSTMVLRHSCDTPRCVNPNHLSEGTHADNMRDKVERQRQPYGEQVWLAKLTDNDVRQIRQLLQSGMKQTEVAKLFPVSSITIGQIHLKKTWRHVV